MAQKLESIDCYVISARQLPLLLPKECVAAVINQPKIETIDEAPARWVCGHVTWQSQRVPVLSYSDLHEPELEKKPPLRKYHM